MIRSFKAAVAGLLLLFLSTVAAHATASGAVSPCTGVSTNFTNVTCPDINEELANANNRGIIRLGTVSGTNTITAAASPYALTSYQDGQHFTLKPAITNTSTVTLNINSIGAKAIVKQSGTALASGDLASSTIYSLQYYAADDHFRVMGAVGTPGVDDDVPEAGDYTNLTGGAGITNSPTGTINFDATEISSATWGAGSFTAFTFNAGAVDPVLTFGSSTLTFSALTTLNLDDEGEFRLFEEDANGSNYIGIKPPAAITSNVTCTLENDSTPFDLCVTASGVSDGDKGDITVSASGSTWTIDAGAVALSTDIAGFGTGVADFLGTPTSANLAAAITNETGSGALVFGTSPTLTTPALGTPSALVLTNATGLPISTGVSGLGSNVATALATSSSANWRSAMSDETGTGAMMFGLTTSMADDLSCTGSQVVRRNAGDTAFECANPAGGGDALTSGTLAQFAATTSAQLAGVLSDEVGTGSAMFGLVSTMADDLSCTASQVVRRNSGDTAFECATLPGGGDALTADPLSQFAATTSAQLLGVISDETGSGALVFSTSPTLVTPVLGVATATSVTVGNTGLIVGASTPFSDSAGTLTLQNVDALDATTETTVEGAIDTAANLTSVQGHTVTLTGAFIRSGAHSLTITTTGTTTVTLPTSGTLATNAAATDTTTGLVELATPAEVETGTDTTRAVTAAGVLAAISGKHTISVPASAMISETTTGCSSGSTETTTNLVMIPTKDCDGATQEGVQFVVEMPKSSDEGTLTARVDWTAASGSGNVIWLLSCLARSNDDAIDTAFGTEVSVTDTVLSAIDLHSAPESGAITPGGTWAQDDVLWCRVQRDADAAGDTLNAVDAKIIGVRWLYTINSPTDD